MDAYACWLAGMTGVESAWRGDLWRLLQLLQEQNQTARPRELVQEMYRMQDGALMMLVHQAVTREGRAAGLMQFLQEGRRQEPERILERLQRQRITCAGFYEEEFPEELRHIPDPPLALYWKGRLPDAARPSLAIIGARMSSPYGRSQARDFAIELARNGVQIVSGMAKGIDGIAGLAALEVSDDSYAVLGSGVDVCYPPDNRQLYDQLVSRGGVISEFPPGTDAVRTNFPQRNRIISALARAVLVIEAREKSGTLITVDMAVEQGRDIFALPGRVTDRTSHGCNELIRQGAFPATSPDDILTYMYSETAMNVRLQNHTMEEAVIPEETVERIERRRKEAAARSEAAQARIEQRLRAMGAVEQTVYELLDASTPSAIDALVDPVRERLERRVSFSEIMRAVTMLLMAGLVRELRVGNYVKVAAGS